jgi:ABC-type branched-subunit amino acid transport system ATPase component
MGRIAVRPPVDVPAPADGIVSDRSGEILLSLEQVSRRFGNVVAVDDVSFALRRGTVHALLGENGAGKTTLMRLAFGMQQPDAGIVRFSGEALTVHSPSTALAHGVGMVHQHFSLVPAMTVAENVALGGRKGYRFDPRNACGMWPVVQGSRSIRTPPWASCPWVPSSGARSSRHSRATHVC